jgi:hypothetical protein
MNKIILQKGEKYLIYILKILQCKFLLKIRLANITKKIIFASIVKFNLKKMNSHKK